MISVTDLAFSVKRVSDIIMLLVVKAGFDLIILKTVGLLVLLKV